jgi:serine/threonine protein kinase/tetratricopeptide (TPR) repeat protein
VEHAVTLDPQRAKSIFLAALEQAEEQRRAFLDEACAGDPELRRRAEQLLRAHERPDSLPEAAQASGPTQDSAPPEDRVGGSSAQAEHPGAVIGPYKLVQEIGEGGMGTVWMAQQTEPVKRLVALKLVKAGMDSKQVIARFEAERQALALMDHVNIARVLDAGATSAGRPFFVMDLVKGVPITKYCDEHHLTPRERLELFIPVCQAVQHAHQKGIIHRDLKPSNVLVAHYDGKPVPKVIDFGVAKAAGQSLTDKTLVTGFGNIVGTLEYMSPEQAEVNQLDIDTRSDIYSLGVLLYELLVGSPPFTKKDLEKAGMLEMLRVIREQEPSKPSTKLSTAEGLPTLAANRGTEPARLTRLVRGELDWIVMKALEKDRNRRYETANGFAMDIQRYLADEPVHACPPSAVYRLGKFVRRYKGPVLAASLAVLSLVAGIVAATWGLLDARQARAAEERAKDAAVAKEAETRAVLDFVEGHIFAAARPEGQDGGLGHNVTLRDAVETALPFVEAGFTDEPLIEARLRMTVGGSFACLGDPKNAKEQFEKAREIYTKHLGPDHRVTLRSMSNLGAAYRALGQYAAAEKLYRETLALRKAVLGPEDRDTLVSMDGLACTYTDLGRYTDALKLGEETLALRKARLGPDHADSLRSMHNLASVYRALGRDADALKLSEETLALLKAKLDPAHPSTLLTMLGLANTYDRLGRYADALKLREETLALQKAKLGPGHPHTLVTMNNLANSYDDAGRHAEALKLHEETLVLRTAKLGLDHPDTFMSKYNVAASYINLGRYADALKPLEETLALRKARLGPDHPDALQSMSGLAVCYDRLGRPEDALKLNQETLALQNAKLGPEHPDTLWTMHNLACCYECLHRRADAVKLFEETLALRKAKLGAAHPRTIETQVRLTRTYRDLGRLEDCRTLWEDALAQSPLDHDRWYGYAELCLFLHNEDAYRRNRKALLERFGKTRDPVVAERTARACLLLPAAGEELRQAADLADRAVTLGDKHSYYGSFMAVKALAEYRLVRFESAIEWGQKADARAWAPTHLVLAMAHERLGHAEEARKSLTDALTSYDWATSDRVIRDVVHALRREAVAAVKLDDAAVHFGMGAGLKRHGRWTDAEQEYREAIRLRPDRVEAHSQLGLVLWEQDRSRDARAAYKEAIRLTPKAPPPSGKPSFVTPWSDSEHWVVKEQELHQLDDAHVGHVLLFGDPNWTDYDFEAEIEIIAGGSEVGLILRATSPSRRLYAVVGAFGNTRHGVLIDGEQGAGAIGLVEGKSDKGGWYRLRVEARGNRFKMHLDGKLLVTVTSDQYPHGCVGLVTNPSRARFRNLKVTDAAGNILHEGVGGILPKAKGIQNATGK